MATPEDFATTDQIFGSLAAQNAATAHLWAFVVIQAGYSEAQARELFDAILRQTEKSDAMPNTIGADRVYAIKQHCQIFLEKIFDDAMAHLRTNRR
ncbi:hypothetical protein [Pelagerythrobacter marinus]|uniref:hypothetical protein n=1 Tax=Pelagerythrobacter marinus TaxID=538382 RepID=UPI002AC8CCDA|nr:hypothetical protein [Pelagerythrobacter marinus]WPZ05635.1 hypothetical protein T8T98_09350 [Pelagerythrobacter marinus]